MMNLETAPTKCSLVNPFDAYCRISLKTSIGKLLKSSEGDVFGMSMPEHVLVKVAGENVFNIGKVGANAAISMKRRIIESGKDNG